MTEEAVQEKAWLRTTSWRQGSVIPEANAALLGLINPNENLCAVIISHDCDIANDDLLNEPHIEVIIGKILNEGEEEGNLTNAKNPRKLHLEYLIDTQNRFIELIATSKKVISKEALSSQIEPDPKFILDSKSIKILQSWLACRYMRHALPNVLVDRLDHNKVSNKLQDAFKKSDKSIVGVYINYDPRNDVLDSSEPYELWINVVYAIDSPEFSEAATKIADKLTQLFKDAYKSNGRWELIELVACKAVSETGFTVRDMRTTEQYRFDHISFRGDEPGPMLAP